MTKFLAGLTSFRRGAWELLASALIALGVLMMMQPWTMTAYSWSFAVTLTGTVLFMIVGKFKE